MQLLTKYDGCTFDNVIPRPGGPYSLYCENCDAWVPNTANHEMRREGFFAHSHFCIKWPDGRIERRGDFKLENTSKI